MWFILIVVLVNPLSDGTESLSNLPWSSDCIAPKGKCESSARTQLSYEILGAFVCHRVKRLGSNYTKLYCFSAFRWWIVTLDRWSIYVKFDASEEKKVKRTSKTLTTARALTKLSWLAKICIFVLEFRSSLLLSTSSAFFFLLRGRSWTCVPFVTYEQCSACERDRSIPKYVEH